MHLPPSIHSTPPAQTLRAYVDMLRMEDRLWAHPTYLKARACGAWLGSACPARAGMAQRQQSVGPVRLLSQCAKPRQTLRGANWPPASPAQARAHLRSRSLVHRAQGISGAVRAYLRLADRPAGGADADEEAALAGMSAEEQKK